MKSIIFSMALRLSFLFIIAQISNAATDCGYVEMSTAACMSFATGEDTTPSPACCTGMQQLAESAKSVDDKKAICRCLKAGNTDGVQDKFLSKIPAICNVEIGFPVSINTNCETLDARKFVCPICQARLANQNLLVDHYSSKHPKEKPPRISA